MALSGRSTLGPAALPLVTKVFPLVTKVFPSVTKVFPMVTKVFPSVTKVFPLVTKDFPSVTINWIKTKSVTNGQTDLLTESRTQSLV